MENRTVLYKNHKNTIGTWKIWSVYDTIYIAHAQVINGSDVVHEEVVLSGKQGRTLEEQVKHRIQSRINKQRDKGYVDTVEEARKGPTNTLNLVQPMLAHPLKRVKKINWSNAWIQVKLDGHRCLITNKGGEIIAYSRQGKVINSIDHITKEFIDVLPEGDTVDGELYCHGIPLQTIGSWIKRKQEDTSRLQYVMYDVVKDIPYIDRYSYINNITLYTTQSEPINSVFHTDDYCLTTHLNLTIEQGYEGLIIRHGYEGYEAGRRSKSLIKVKKFEDGEFEVIGIDKSKDGWGILQCITNDGGTFGVSAPGNIVEKTAVYTNKDDYIGRMVTVEYSMLTNDGIPFHPVAIRFREDI